MRLLKIEEVFTRLSVRRTTVYKLVKSGKLAKPVQISPRRVGWRESDIEAFIASCTDSTHYAQ